MPIDNDMLASETYSALPHAEWQIAFACCVLLVVVAAVAARRLRPILSSRRRRGAIPATAERAS